MKENLRNFFQMIIIKTSFPPLSFLYKILYLIAVRWAALVLGSVNGVEAIYLRRGLSRNEIVYGLSDIDLSVIVSDGKKVEITLVKEKISSVYDKLSHFIPLFGQANREFGLYSTSEFFRLYADYPFFKHRVNEGKKTWKLLFGRDIVKDLPEIEESELYFLATKELEAWWRLVNIEFSSGYALPQFERKYLWYKAIAEASKVYLLVCRGKKVYRREAALSEVGKCLNQEQNQCIEQVRHYVKTLTSKDDFLVDDMMKLFMELTGHIYSETERKTHKRAIRKRAILTSLHYNDLIIDKEISHKLEEIEGYIKRELAAHLDYVALLPQIYFGINVVRNFDIDSLYLVLAPKEFISVEKLRGLDSLLGKVHSLQELEPLIKHKNVFFSLRTKTKFNCVWTAGESPLFCSLVNHFLLDKIKKSEKRKTFVSALPPDFEDCIRKRVARIDEIISNPDVYKMKTLGFLRFFWGATRTKLLNHFLESDCIYVPLTSRQICEMVSQRFPENSEWLNDLYGEYRKELQGEESQAYHFFTESIDFLKRI